MSPAQQGWLRRYRRVDLWARWLWIAVIVGALIGAMVGYAVFQGTWLNLKLALFGCGVVGRGVYETVKRYPRRFQIRHVVVRELARYPDIEHLTTDPAVFLDESVQVVMICFGGVTLAYPLILAALNAGKLVITAKK